MNLSLILFLIGILGFVFNRKNIILMLISIEIMLLAITFLILISSLSFDDILGQTYAIYIIAIAGAESAIGLGILVAFYRLNSSFKSYPYFIAPLKNLLLCFASKNIWSFATKVRFFSTNAKQMRSNNIISRTNKLDSSFITGLIDAEGSFVVTILKNARYRLGWVIQARFQFKLHEKDRALVLAIQDFYNNIGYISNINKRNSVEFIVTNIKDLYVVISHLESNPLLTNKCADFLLFKEIYSIIIKNKHYTPEGLQKIINNKAAMNWGLSENLKESFTLTLQTPRPLVTSDINNITPEWVAGFLSLRQGESNFSIFITGKYASVRFSVSQDIRDALLLENLGIYLSCGKINKYKNRDVCELVVAKIDDIVMKVIPFFEKYPIKGSKYNNYIYFKEAAFIIKNKEHLINKGMDRIRELKAIINKE
jgi:NADH:ubiquinone oxidoreductase subunit K